MDRDGIVNSIEKEGIDKSKKKILPYETITGFEQGTLKLYKY
jgi:hypothetical protein